MEMGSLERTIESPIRLEPSQGGRPHQILMQIRIYRAVLSRISIWKGRPEGAAVEKLPSATALLGSVGYGNSGLEPSQGASLGFRV